MIQGNVSQQLHYDDWFKGTDHHTAIGRLIIQGLQARVLLSFRSGLVACCFDTNF